ncbi:hypothetical protein TanjilG_22814 [Lupinus angustifolius]|uniref:ZF-HD dimerization-type domain-containing protein n=2 Tax=Lupinus angustifolius TaxID=3871 RepID=A0A4P1RHK4_LUPAN|nr:hypothetical protein TanjilG_22814 [Lupinus angustifolius]
MGGQDKEIEMPNTLGYKRDSSSKLSSPTSGERSDHQPSPAPQISHLSHHHHLYPPLAPTQLHQSQKPSVDPDISSSPIVTTSITITPITPPQITINTTASIRYRECLRNHAASMGNHVVDGCGEFMPSGEGAPESLKCAVCDCHRNFHRKEAEGEPLQHASNYYAYHPNKHNNTHNIIPSPPPYHNNHPLQFHAPSLSKHQHHRFSHGVATLTSLIPPRMVAFGSGGGTAESFSEDINMFQSNSTGQILVQPPFQSKKRFRTKFTQQQKDRMMVFAEKLEWKIQKQDEQEVQQFCSQVGLRKQVFKVWMHNNKQIMKKRQM